VPIKDRDGYKKIIELGDLLRPVLANLHKEKNLRHYRLAGYGQHVGLIVSYLDEHLKNNPLNNQTAVLSSLKTPEGIDTLETLSEAASKVIRDF
jgi:hypothetical protein